MKSLVFTKLLFLALLGALFSGCKKDNGIVPVACFTSGNNVDTSRTVIFTDCSTNAVRWDWDFGDHTTASGQQVTHSWNTYGNKNVTLTVYSADEHISSISKTVKVDPRWRFTGSYYTTQSCGSWNNPYFMNVTLFNQQLKFSNFNGMNWEVFSDDTITEGTLTAQIEAEELVDGLGKHWDVSGHATLNGNVLTFSYTVSNAAYYIGESASLAQYSCTAAGTK